MAKRKKAERLPKKTGIKEIPPDKSKGETKPKWQYSFMAPGGTKRKGGMKWVRRFAATKKEAEILLAKAKVELREGRYLDVRKHSISFPDLVKRYLKWSKTEKAKKTYAEDEDFSRIWLASSHFKKPIADITGTDIQNYKDELSKMKRYEGRKRADGKPYAGGKQKISPRRVNMNIARLKRMLKKAVEWELLGKVPKIQFLKQVSRQHFILDYAQESELLAQCDDKIKPIVIIGLATGMREAEILSMPWECVNIKEKKITLKAELTKTAKARVIPLNKELVKMFEKMPEPVSKSLKVFQGAHGKGLEKDFRRRWERAREAAKMPTLRFHDLRHTFATRYYQATRDLLGLQRLLGHATLEMVRVYAETFPEDLRAGIEAMEKAREIEAGHSEVSEKYQNGDSTGATKGGESA